MESENYQGPERRRWIRISNAERAAIIREACRATTILLDDAVRGLPGKTRDLVWQDIKVQVGEVTIRIVLYVVGAGAIALLAWLGIHQGLPKIGE